MLKVLTIALMLLAANLFAQSAKLSGRVTDSSGSIMRDAHVKVYRAGHVIADQAVQFGGNTLFEVRVGDAAQLGRYRRLGR